MDFVYYRFYLVQMTKADVFNHWVSVLTWGISPHVTWTHSSSSQHAPLKLPFQSTSSLIWQTEMSVESKWSKSASWWTDRRRHKLNCLFFLSADDGLMQCKDALFCQLLSSWVNLSNWSIKCQKVQKYVQGCLFWLANKSKPEDIQITITRQRKASELRGWNYRREWSVHLLVSSLFLSFCLLRR